MATKIQVRRDTAANWTSADPILSQGEMGYETDTGYMKIGDGATAWTSLAYFVDNDANTTYDLLTTGGGSPVLSLQASTGVNDDITLTSGTGMSVSESANTVTFALNANLADLNNVLSTTPTTNDVLQWTGSAYEPQALTATDVGGLAAVATSGAYSDLSGTPALATVATTGSYTDLTNPPTIPSNVGDLGNVSGATPSAGQHLLWNGSQWEPTYQFTSSGTEFFYGGLYRKQPSYYATDHKEFPGHTEGDAIDLRDGPFSGGWGAGQYYISRIDADFVANFTDSDTNFNRVLRYKIIVDNNYIAGSETDIVIIGKKSDPSFTYPKTYTLRTGDGTTYTYNATGESERNFFTGITALGIPGLTIGFDSDNPDYINPTQITYTPQYVGDTLELVEPANPAESGWDHLAMEERVYSLASGDNGAFRSPGVIMTGIQFGGSTQSFEWVGGGKPVGATGRWDIFDITMYYASGTRKWFVEHSSTGGLDANVFTGDLTGSVFAEDSTLLIDALNGTIVNPRITGGVTENNIDLFGATGTVVHDTSTTHIFYHSGLAADFTANFTNVSLNNNEVTSMSLILEQGATAYIPTAVQIDGAAQTLLWQGGSAPTGTANGVDHVTFSLIYNGSSYTVLGQLASYS